MTAKEFVFYLVTICTLKLRDKQESKSLTKIGLLLHGKVFWTMNYCCELYTLIENWDIYYDRQHFIMMCFIIMIEKWWDLWDERLHLDIEAVSVVHKLISIVEIGHKQHINLAGQWVCKALLR